MESFHKKNEMEGWIAGNSQISLGLATFGGPYDSMNCESSYGTNLRI